MLEQTNKQNARTGCNCLENDENTEWKSSIEEEQLDAIRDPDFSVFLVHVLSCCFCPHACGLIGTTWLQHLQVLHPYAWHEARRRAKSKEAYELSLSPYRGKAKASLENPPFKLSLILFYPKLYHWANAGWNVTSEKGIVDKGCIEQSSEFVQNLSSKDCWEY